jgi:zinc protease
MTPSDIPSTSSGGRMRRPYQEPRKPMVTGRQRRRRSAFICLLGGAILVSGALGAQGSPPRPTPGPAPSVRVPRIIMRTLSNGVRVAVLENHDFPVVDVSALVIAPRVLDPPGKEGVSSFSAQMLAEGTKTRSADDIAQAEADLGTPVSARGFFTITQYFEPALRLMADQLLNPAYPQAALDRIKANSLARLERLQADPGYLAGRVFAQAVYGAGHPYARTETRASIAAIRRADLVKFHHDFYRPRNVTFVVAGDVTPDGAAAALERAFGSWEVGGEDGWVVPPAPASAGPTRIYLYNRPTSPQSVILAGQMGPRRDSKDYYAIELMNTVLGGAFNSRLNLSLREVHGYTYGASSGFAYRRVPEPATFEASADVSTPTTDSSVTDLMTEIRQIRSSRPVTDSELAFAKRTEILSLPLQFSTVPQIADAAAELLEFRLPLDYYDHVTENFEGVTIGQIGHAAVKYLDPDHLAIVVVGDRKAVEPGLAAAGVAPIVDVKRLH